MKSLFRQIFARKYLAIVVLASPICLLTLSAYIVVSEIYESTLVGRIKTQAQFSTQSIQNVIALTDEKVLLLGNNTQALQYLKSLRTVTDKPKSLTGLEHLFRTELQNDLREILRQRNYIDHVRYVDKTGQEIIRIDRDTKSYPLKNVSQRDYFKEIMQLQPGELYISPINLNREGETGELEKPYKPTFRIATPVFNELKEIEGFFITNLLAKEIFQVANDEALERRYGTELIISNADGYYLQHPDPAFEYAFEFDDKKSDAEMKVSKYLWQKIIRNRDGIIYNHKIQGDSYLVIYDTVYLYPNNEQLKIKLLYFIPDEIAFQKLRDVALFFFALGLISLAALLITLSGLYQVYEENKDLEKKEEELRIQSEAAAEANTLKSRFLASMSHEIRTPLNGVIGLAEVLSTTMLNSEQRDFVLTIESSGQHLLGLINEILDLSKLEANEVEIDYQRFNLRGLLKETLDSFRLQAAKKDIDLVLSMDDDLSDSYVGDRFRLRQILTNFVGNALKFTETGEVFIGVSRFEQDLTSWLEERKLQPNLFDDFESPALLKIIVRDTGIGISEAAQAKIFEPFSQAEKSTTRKYGGTGLGLSISSHLVTLMGGKFGVESVLGEGAEFWFVVVLDELPVGTVPTVEGLQKRFDTAKTTAGRSPQHRIMVVEDNVVNQKVIDSILKRLGYQADILPNGQKALERLAVQDYDLVFMDYHMPVLDGHEATRQIRKNPDWQQLPIIGLSASAMRDDLERCLEAGMNDYLTKPTKIDQVADMLEKWLGRESESGDVSSAL